MRNYTALIFLATFLGFLGCAVLAHSEELPEESVEAVEALEDEIVYSPTSATSTAYTLHPGSLRDQLLSWSVVADYQLKWKCDYDIMVEFDSSFARTFPVAVGQVVQALRSAGTPISGTLFKRSKVLVISGE